MSCRRFDQSDGHGSHRTSSFAGLGWLTFASPTLAKALYPLNFLPGIIGEGSLTVALLVVGVNVEPRKAPLHT